MLPWAFPGSIVVKNPANAGDTRDVGLILGSGRSLEHEMNTLATYASTLAWKFSWTEETGGLQSMRSQRVGHD